jgi:hypothetical protein
MEGFNDAIQRMVTGMRERSDSPSSSQQQELQMEIQEATPEPAEST